MTPTPTAPTTTTTPAAPATPAKPSNVYECMFLLDPNKVSGDVQGAAKQLHTLLERNGAEIIASRPWDERKLAYPIKNVKKGLYYLTCFRCEGPKVPEMERDFLLAELIVRHMIIKVDPKLEQAVIELAKNEHALALQTVTEPGPDDDHLGGGDDRPRRGPRRPVEAGAGKDGD
jgi:small subunit ribosomal protein S6